MSKKFVLPGGCIVQYVRHKNRKPFACLISSKDENNKIQCGWSMCDKNDKFVKDRAKEIAYGRMTIGSDKDIPNSLMKDVEYFFERSNRYFFKNEKIKSPIMKNHTKLIKNGSGMIIAQFNINNFSSGGKAWCNSPVKPDIIAATYNGKTVHLTKTLKGYSFKSGATYIPKKLFEE